MELAEEAVYRIDPDGTVERVLSQPSIERPNGLAITPDARTLYVIDSHTRPGGHRKVWAFDIDDRGPLRAAAGLRLRPGPRRRRHAARWRGNLWVAAGINFPRHAGETADVPAGVYVFAPGGDLLGHIPIPEDVCTNLAFGGPDLSMLHVTSGKTVYKVPTGRLRVCPLSAQAGVIGTPREDGDRPDGPADRQRSGADYADGPAADAEAACLDPADVAVARGHPEPDREGDGGRREIHRPIRMTAPRPRWRYRLPRRPGRGSRPRDRDSRRRTARR